MKTIYKISILVLLGLLTSCQVDPGQKYLFNDRQMGVEFRYTLYADSKEQAEKAVTAANKRVSDLNQIYSDYIVDSELWKLSNSSGQDKPVKVSKELWHILKKSTDFSKVSDGAFDITAGPYFFLWRKARVIKSLPLARSMARAANKVGIDKIVFDDQQQTVTLKAKGMRLDLGGIAKGYAADEALRVLLSHGVKYALVDASGDIAMSASPTGQWPIYLADDDSTESQMIQMQHGAVATSGDTLQFVEIGGKRYSHIVNPKTGIGVTNRCRVTIIAEDCMTADAMASTVTVLGPQKGLELVEKMDGVEAFIQQVVGEGLKSFKSSGFPELKIKKK